MQTENLKVGSLGTKVPLERGYDRSAGKWTFGTFSRQLPISLVTRSPFCVQNFSVLIVYDALSTVFRTQTLTAIL